MSTHFVIVGNGAAGYRAAKAVRRADSDAQVSLFTEEEHPFYLRRQLGDFLAGNLTLSELIFQSRNSYRRERIDLFLATPVVGIDPAAHEVILASGQRVRYDRLLLATGTRPVPLDIPGAGLGGVATFDTLATAIGIQPLLDDARRAVILGEGVIGLAMAESLTQRGMRVTQFLRRERFWPDVLDETTSALVERVLEGNGVALRRGEEARAIIGAADRAIGVETGAGETLPAELVAAGCRRQPAVELVEGSGIEVGRGIRVDASLRTNQPDVFAAGDVTEPVGSDEFASGGLPVCWQRAWDQGALAAAAMLGRKAEAALEAVRIRTAVFGVDLAVIGRGHLPAGGDVAALDMQDEPQVFRRLVFEKDLLVGAVVFGTGEFVHELNRLVAQRAPREVVETTLRISPEPPVENVLQKTFAQHCPICAAELVMHRGTPIGSRLRCSACNTDLEITWDGRRVRLEVPRH